MKWRSTTQPSRQTDSKPDPRGQRASTRPLSKNTPALDLRIKNTPSPYLEKQAMQNKADDVATLLCLTSTALKYVSINHGDQRVFQFEIIINVLVSSFCFI